MKPFTTSLLEQARAAVTPSRYAMAITAVIAIVLALAMACTSDTQGNDNALPGIRKDIVVDFPGMELRPAIDKASFTLAGSMRNRSRHHTITEVKLRLTMVDVLLYGAATTVGETFVVLKLELPPGQSRHFSENISFRTLPEPKGRHEWDYAVMGILVKK